MSLDAQFYITIGSPGVLTEVVGVDNISPKFGTRNMNDVTDLGVTNEREKHEPGFQSPDTVSVEGFYSGADTQVALLTAKNSGALIAYKVEYPEAVAGGKTFTFSGYVTEFQITKAPKTKARFTASIEVDNDGITAE